MAKTLRPSVEGAKPSNWPELLPGTPTRGVAVHLVHCESGYNAAELDHIKICILGRQQGAKPQVIPQVFPGPNQLAGWFSLNMR